MQSQATSRDHAGDSWAALPLSLMWSRCGHLQTQDPGLSANTAILWEAKATLAPTGALLGTGPTQACVWCVHQHARVLGGGSAGPLLWKRVESNARAWGQGPSKPVRTRATESELSL